jgi:hypothetical protein
MQKSISKLIFSGYTGSKNSFPNRLKIQFIELDFFRNQVQINRGMEYGERICQKMLRTSFYVPIPTEAAHQKISSIPYFRVQFLQKLFFFESSKCGNLHIVSAL